MDEDKKELVDAVKKEKTEQVKEEKKDLVSKANEAAERLEKANLELKDLLAKHEALIAEDRLGGKSFAGTFQKTKTPEDKVKEEAMNLLKGTGLNPFK